MLQNLGDDGAVFGYQRVEFVVDDVHFGIRLDLHPQGPSFVGGASADPGAGQTGDHDIPVVIGVLNLGEGSYRGKAPIETGNKQKPPVATRRGGESVATLRRLDPQRDGHVRKDHAVAQR